MAAEFAVALGANAASQVVNSFNLLLVRRCYYMSVNRTSRSGEFAGHQDRPNFPQAGRRQPSGWCGSLRRLRTGEFAKALGEVHAGQGPAGLQWRSASVRCRSCWRSRKPPDAAQGKAKQRARDRGMKMLDYPGGDPGRPADGRHPARSGWSSWRRWSGPSASRSMIRS